MFDNLPPGTHDHDADAPWNEQDFDGADTAHGIAAVTGDDADSTLETFAEFTADLGDQPKPIISGTTWLRPNASDADLLKLMLSDKGTSSHVQLAAWGELRARYLAAPYTQRVIEVRADAWRAEKREAMWEGSL